MSTFVKRLALYKAQGGARICDLEQLQASISLPSTIKMVLSLRQFTRTSAVLVVVWSFYYIGSQASGREYRYVTHAPFHQMLAAFPNDQGKSDFDGGNLSSIHLRTLSLGYHSAQNEATGDFRNRRLDLGVDGSGNVLVPDMYYSVEPYGQHEIASWFDLTPSDVTYASWAGLPISYLTAAIDPSWRLEAALLGHYSINTSYFKVKCASLEMVPTEDFPKGARRSVSLNLTAQDNIIQTSGVRIFEVWTKWNSSDWFDTIPGESIVSGSPVATAKMICNVRRPHVELRVRCSEKGCSARKMRYLPPEDESLLRTPFDDGEWSSKFFDTLLSMDPLPSIIDPAPRVSSIDYQIGIGQYMTQMATDGVRSFPRTAPSFGCTSLDYNEPCILAWHSFDITQAFNTWYIVSRMDWTDPGQSFGGFHGPEHGFDYVQVNGAPWNPHYALSLPWLIADFVSCATLLAIAVYSFWLRRHTLAPDVFGYVSSSTRDNVHFPLPEGGSALSGIQRTRHMQNVKIKIGDVGTGGDVGRIGVVYAWNEDVSGLKKDGKYL